MLVFSIEYKVPSVKSGFYCEDPSISHKFEGDTVPSKWVFLLMGLPLIFVSLNSNQNQKFLPKFVPNFQIPLFEKVNDQFNKKSSFSAWERSYFYLKGYTFGFILLFAIMTATRTVVGEKRPHFMDTCRPDKAFNCTKGLAIILI